MFFDKLAQKRYTLENSATLLNTFQGRVVETNKKYTGLSTPLGYLRVPPTAGDRLGSRRFRIKTGLGETDSPF